MNEEALLYLVICGLLKWFKGSAELIHSLFVFEFIICDYNRYMYSVFFAMFYSVIFMHANVSFIFQLTLKNE